MKVVLGVVGHAGLNGAIWDFIGRHLGYHLLEKL